MTKKQQILHGHAIGGKVSPEYRSYRSMLRRCYDQNYGSFALYGATGIDVCDRWKESFSNFLEDMGKRPLGMTIDRIDNSKGYFPNNCRWASAKQQARNRKSNKIVVINGEKFSIIEAAERFSIPFHTLYTRIFKLGWMAEKAVSEPVRTQYRHVTI